MLKNHRAFAQRQKRFAVVYIFRIQFNIYVYWECKPQPFSPVRERRERGEEEETRPCVVFVFVFPLLSPLCDQCSLVRLFCFLLTEIAFHHSFSCWCWCCWCFSVVLNIYLSRPLFPFLQFLLKNHVNMCICSCPFSWHL